MRGNPNLVSMFIYKITNKIDGKQYIGQTINSVERRWNNHCSTNHCKYLYSAIMKYGRENFIVETIATCNSLEELNKMEHEYITELNTLVPNGYNIRPGGNNSSHSKETREKLSVSHTGSRHNNFGKHLSLETRLKISRSNKGRKFSEEHKEKLSKVRIERKIPSATRKPIICNETGVKYDSLHEAAQYFCVKATSICAVLKGRHKTCKGYTFSYI